MSSDARARTSLSLSLVPFAAAAVIAWVSVIIGSSIDWGLYAIATALLLLSGALAVLHAAGIWRMRYAATVASFVFLGAVALLRQSAGGTNSGVAVMSLIPVFYVALFTEGRRELYAVLAGMVIFYLAPILLIGPPHYPHTQYRAALLTVSVSAIIGLVTARLVADVRRQAEEAQSRERMLAEVNKLARRLLGSTQARQDVCEAARSMAGAQSAMIYEPIPQSDRMRSTALAGLEAEPIEISLLQPSAVADVYCSGEPALITERLEEHVGSLELWTLAGRPQSVLYEPMLRGREPVGVLVVAWAERVVAESTRASVVALLAREAAAVIDRADALSELTDMAGSDPLTGLPNRRTWDAHLKRAMAKGQRFAIAMLDFDHFKEFNDTHGHPAGDRLLKETASIWRDQLRNDDLLARLGGEEFGLLLLECNTPVAMEVIERLRTSISDKHTCSAGFAQQLPGESAEQVMVRADTALYEAKASGRDRIAISA